MVQDNLRVAGVVEESIVDGPGIRYTLFLQGCSHNCKGCHNTHTQDFSGGKLESVDDIIKDITENPLLDGVTLSGGEPFEQPEALSILVLKLKNLGYHIITYSGYTFEELMEKSIESDAIKTLLKHIDILVDGEFHLEERNLRLKFRGSENQRIIDIYESLRHGEAVVTEF